MVINNHQKVINMIFDDLYQDVMTESKSDYDKLSNIISTSIHNFLTSNVDELNDGDLSTYAKKLTQIIHNNISKKGIKLNRGDVKLNEIKIHFSKSPDNKFHIRSVIGSPKKKLFNDKVMLIMIDLGKTIPDIHSLYKMIYKNIRHEMEHYKQFVVYGGDIEPPNLSDDYSYLTNKYEIDAYYIEALKMFKKGFFKTLEDSLKSSLDDVFEMHNIDRKLYEPIHSEWKRRAGL